MIQSSRSVLCSLLLAVALLVFVSGASDVWAQSLAERNMSARMQRIEKEIDTLNRALFRGETPPSGVSAPSSYASDDASVRAATELRLSQLETELRELRGQIERQGHELRELKSTFERMQSDIEMRLGQAAQQAPMETQPVAAGGTPSGNLAGQVAKQQPPYSWSSSRGGSDQGQNGGAPLNLSYEQSLSESHDAPSAAGTVQQLGSYNQKSDTGAIRSGGDAAASIYENAFALLKNENYAQAEQEFTAFLAQHPDHALAGNAKYWLGETFYVRGDYEQAARAFAQGYRQYPESAKAADNLLKLSMSLAALGQKDDACVALSQFDAAGFKASAPVARRAQQEKTRLGC